MQDQCKMVIHTGNFSASISIWNMPLFVSPFGIHGFSVLNKLIIKITVTSKEISNAIWASSIQLCGLYCLLSADILINYWNGRHLIPGKYVCNSYPKKSGESARGTWAQE